MTAAQSNFPPRAEPSSLEAERDVPELLDHRARIGVWPPFQLVVGEPRVLGHLQDLVVDVLPGRCDDLLIRERRERRERRRRRGLALGGPGVRTLSVAMAATNRTSSERCGMSLLLTQDTCGSGAGTLGCFMTQMRSWRIPPTRGFAQALLRDSVVMSEELPMARVAKRRPPDPGATKALLHGNCVVSPPAHPLYPSAVGTARFP